MKDKTIKKTIDVIKEKRSVPEALRNWRKVYNQHRKQIKDALKSGPKTIPDIAASIGLSASETIYYVMTMRKYGEIEAGEPDDMDEYFFYQLKATE